MIPDIERIVKFTEQYHASLEGMLSQLGRDSLPYHGGETRFVEVFGCSNGFASFYYPPSPPGFFDQYPEAGMYAGSFPLYSTNSVVQTLHRRLLATRSLPIGHRLGSFLPYPDDVPLVPRLITPALNPELSEKLVEKNWGAVLPAVLVGQRIRADQGVVVEQLPCRIKIWSPVVRMPDGAMYRVFRWTHADFWWEAGKLKIEESDPSEIAALDLLAFRFSGPFVQNLIPLGDEPAKVEAEDPALGAAEILIRHCNQFLSHLRLHGDNEQEIHSWLQQDSHHIFLDPHAKEVRSKVAFGAEISDFVVRRSDGTYIVIEIERANIRILKKNGDPGHEFNHATNQVANWQRYIRDNVLTVRNEQGLEGIYEPRGMVVLGRSDDIQDWTKWRDLKAGKHDLFTYDEIIERVQALAEQLKKLESLGRT